MGFLTPQRIPNSSVSLMGISPLGALIGTSTNAPASALLLSLTVHIQGDVEENAQPAAAPQSLFRGISSCPCTSQGGALLSPAWLPSFPLFFAALSSISLRKSSTRYCLNIFEFEKNTRLRTSLLCCPWSLKAGYSSITEGERDQGRLCCIEGQNGRRWEELFW